MLLWITLLGLKEYCDTGSVSAQFTDEETKVSWGQMTLSKNLELGSDCQSSGTPSTFLQSLLSLFHMAALPGTPKCPFMGTKMGTPPPTPLGSYSCCTLSNGWRLGFPSRDWLSQSSSAWEQRLGFIPWPHSPYLNMVPWWPGSSQILKMSKDTNPRTHLHFFIKDHIFNFSSFFCFIQFPFSGQDFFFFSVLVHNGICAFLSELYPM